MSLFGAFREGTDGLPEIATFESDGCMLPLICQAPSKEAATRQFASKLGARSNVIYLQVVKFDRAASESFEGRGGYGLAATSGAPIEDAPLIEILGQFLAKVLARSKSSVAPSQPASAGARSRRR